MNLCRMEHHLRTGDWGKLGERKGQLKDSLKQEIVSFMVYLNLTLAEQN
jgi:hypothetical protein